MEIRKIIYQLLKKEEYITIDRMISIAMFDTEYSYYLSDKIIGKSGDFITAPEISQLFGEILGLWVIKEWYRLGRPSSINLVELGPGNGILMRDILKTIKLEPILYKIINLELLEINPFFIEEQKCLLKKFDSSFFSNNSRMNYISSIENITGMPSIIIANEFFDVLPIKQYIKDNGLWYEVVIILNSKNQIQFSKTIISTLLQNYLQRVHSAAPNGGIVEISNTRESFLKSLVQHIKEFSGSILIIDYGYCFDSKNRNQMQYNSTLQAIKSHKYVSIIETLGEADLSSHVDFYLLKSIIYNLNINNINLFSQSDFLIDNGILFREQELCKKNSFLECKIIKNQVQRLISYEGMGNLFKVLEILI